MGPSTEGRGEGMAWSGAIQVVADGVPGLFFLVPLGFVADCKSASVPCCICHWQSFGEQGCEEELPLLTLQAC